MSSEIDQLKGLLENINRSMWDKPSDPNTMNPTGISIPIKIETSNGSLRCYMSFPGSAVSDPDKLRDLIRNLESQGVPLDVWKGKKTWGTGGRRGSW